MSRPPRRRTALFPVVVQAGSPSGSPWPLKVQTLQVHAATDMLGVFSRYVAALTAARDAKAIGDAQRTVVAGWMACIVDAQRRWAELARLVPPEAWTALGWRVEPQARASLDSVVDDIPRDLFEQSKLGIEMLWRPWMTAHDLEHTEEFVA